MHDPNDFLSRLVTMDETWLYHYDPETRQPWMEWQHSGSTHPAPKILSEKNPLEKVSPQFFGIKTASSSLIILQRAKLSTRSITHFCWCWQLKDILKENTAWRSPMVSCSCMTMPRLTGHLQPRRNWPTWASSVITHPILWILPGRTTPVPWIEKTSERSPFFVWRGGHCCRGDLTGRTTFWTFFWVACKS